MYPATASGFEFLDAKILFSTLYNKQLKISTKIYLSNFYTTKSVSFLQNAATVTTDHA
jgi:hypothetical protein